ncbi:MAG TPA: Ig-like domain-containing protein [Gemmatimonadales bacterium]|nr:Ig-like domain-containing protein [Gemmatimonadales bacterium]
MRRRAKRANETDKADVESGQCEGSSAPTAFPPFRHTALLALSAVLACAKMAPPPGGPTDHIPPILLSTVPESVGVYPDWDKDVEFRFDEIVSEGSTPSMGLGTGDLERLILVSPSHEIPRIKWKRDRITVRPREGWKPNRVYRIELLPGIVDLSRNKTDTSIVITFSTGGPLPTDTVEGQAVDWVAGQYARQALIALALMPDTLIYRTLTDSSGRFRIGPLPQGEYVAFAVLDANHNLQKEDREAFDSVRVPQGTMTIPTLWIYPHDSVGPHISGITANDSVSATITFTQPLDPRQQFDSLQVLLRELPDSIPVHVASLLPKPVDDSIQLVVRARIDSLVADSIARDTTARADTLAGKKPKFAQPPPVHLPSRPSPGAADSTALKQLLAQRPALFDKLVLRVDSAFKPGGKYLVDVPGIRNVNGVASEEARAGFAVPEIKEEKKDSVVSDTTGAKPDAGKP